MNVMLTKDLYKESGSSYEYERFQFCKNNKQGFLSYRNHHYSISCTFDKRDAAIVSV